jgi:hypothetical protein
MRAATPGMDAAPRRAASAICRVPPVIEWYTISTVFIPAF